MRVLVAHNRYRSSAPSGENRVVDVETEALRARGHEVEHFERHSDDIADWSPARQAALPLRVVWSADARRDLELVLRRFRPDVLHVHNTFPLLSPSVLYASRDAGVPVVVTLHNYKLLCASGDFFREGAVCHRCAGGSPVPGLIRGCYRGSRLATLPVSVGALAHREAWRSLPSAYVVVSAAQRDLLGGLGLDPARVFVKHNLVPTVATTAPLAERNRCVAYVGRLDAAKGLPFLMRAWDRYLVQAGDDALDLVIAGGGPLEEDVRAWAAERPSVRVEGLLSPAGCRALLARARAVLLPSAWEETFGLVVVEAMAVGTPAVAAAHGSFPELVTDGVDGALFDPADTSSLVSVLHDVQVRPETYEAYGAAALVTHRRCHDPSRNLDLLEEVYDFALSHPRSDAGDSTREGPRWTDGRTTRPARP